jgi:hypothetical protein
MLLMLLFLFYGLGHEMKNEINIKDFIFHFMPLHKKYK